VKAGRRHLLTAACTVAGIALFVYVVGQAGIGEILDGVRRVGWGLAVLLALAGLRFVIRSQSWRLCMPDAARLPLGRAFQAFLAGDSVGNITPLGLVASEPTKVFLSRHHLATRDAIASLAAENVIYATSVATMVSVGLLVVLLTVAMPLAWRWGLGAALLGIAAVVIAGRRLLRGTWDESRGARPRWRERIAVVRQAVAAFSAGQTGRFQRAYALDLAYHSLAVLEVFLTLRWVLGDRSPSLTQAIAFEALNRVIVVAFKFVPFRVGVDEALTGAAAPLLALDPAAGVTLAVVRKVRNLFWTGVGLAIIAAHPAQSAPPAAPFGTAPARQP
jgi:hypothetical protein